MNQLGEPDAGKLPVRFDERRLETGLRLLRQSWTLLNLLVSKLWQKRQINEIAAWPVGIQIHRNAFVMEKLSWIEP